MARKTLDVTIPLQGRDLGKTFRITEMSASAAEDWATRAILALMQSGVQLPEDFRSMGMAGVFSVGIDMLARISYADLKPLMDDMWACITIKMPAAVRELIEDDIEEAQTRFWLRRKVLELHIDFFTAAGESSSPDAGENTAKS